MLLTKRRFQSLRRVFRWSSATFRHLRHPNRPPEPAIAPACLFIGRSSSIALAATSTSDHDAPGQRKSQEAQARQAKGQASCPQTEDAAAELKEWGGRLSYKGRSKHVGKPGLLAQVKAYLDGQDSAVAAATVTEGTAKASATETEELNTEHHPETIPCPLLVIDALGVTNWGCPLYSQEMELMEEQQLAELL